MTKERLIEIINSSSWELEELKDWLLHGGSGFDQISNCAAMLIAYKIIYEIETGKSAESE